MLILASLFLAMCLVFGPNLTVIIHPFGGGNDQSPPKRVGWLGSARNTGWLAGFTHFPWCCCAKNTRRKVAVEEEEAKKTRHTHKCPNKNTSQLTARVAAGHRQVERVNCLTLPIFFFAVFETPIFNRAVAVQIGRFQQPTHSSGAPKVSVVHRIHGRRWSIRRWLLLGESFFFVLFWKDFFPLPVLPNMVLRAVVQTRSASKRCRKPSPHPRTRRGLANPLVWLARWWWILLSRWLSLASHGW